MRIQVLVLTAALAATTAGLARADDKKPGGEGIAAPKDAPVASAPVAGAPCTQMATICVKEMVCEPYTYTRTTYKHECKQECYTAYRCETVQVPKTRTVCTMKKVCETVMETRCTTVKVPVCEQRVEMKSTWKKVSYTEMKSKTVRSGHYECSEVPARTGLFHKSDPCCCECCTKTVKKWVSCKETVCEPVCKTKWEKCCEPVCKTVHSYRCETRTCQVPVTRTRCIPETHCETYMTCETHRVPYTATRTVNVCVPVCETCQGTRMVCRTVQKQVPVTNCCTCCPAPCCCH